MTCTTWTTKGHPSSSCYDANPLCSYFPCEREPVDTAGTCLHAGPFASRAPGAVTSSQEATRSIERGSMFSNQQDLEVCFTASTETLLHHHTLLPAERAAVKQMVSTWNFARDAALNPNGHWAASLRLWRSCHCRQSSDRPGGIATSNSLSLA